MKTFIKFLIMLIFVIGFTLLSSVMLNRLNDHFGFPEFLNMVYRGVQGAITGFISINIMYAENTKDFKNKICRIFKRK